MDYQAFITRALGDGINVLDFESFDYPAVANFLKRAPEFCEAVKAVKILEISGADLLLMPRERFEKTLNLSDDIAHHLAEIVDKVRSLGAILKPAATSSGVSSAVISGSASGVVKKPKSGKSSRSKSSSSTGGKGVEGVGGALETCSGASTAAENAVEGASEVEFASATSVVAVAAASTSTATATATAKVKSGSRSGSTTANKGLALIKTAAAASARAKDSEGAGSGLGTVVDAKGEVDDYMSFDPCIGIEAGTSFVDVGGDVAKGTPLKRYKESCGVDDFPATATAGAIAATATATAGATSTSTSTGTSKNANVPLTTTTGSKYSTALESAPLAAATTTSTATASRGTSEPRRNPIAKPKKTTTTTTVNRSAKKRKQQSGSTGVSSKQVPILSYTGKRDFNIVDRCIKASIYYPIRGCYFDFTNVVEVDVDLTHLVAAICIQRPTLKVLYALARAAYILTPSFVYQAEEEEKWPSESEHEHPKWPLRRNRLHIPHMMQGTSFFLYGRFRKFNHTDMVALIELCGGTCVEDMSSCSHLIVKQGASPSLATSLEIPRNVTIVTEDWITASIEAGNIQVPPDFAQPSQTATSRSVDINSSTLVKHGGKNVVNARLSACSTIDSLDASLYLT